jgi:hypothetical protein
MTVLGIKGHISVDKYIDKKFLNADVTFFGYETDFQQIKYMLRLVVVAFFATTILYICKNDIVLMIDEMML